MNVKPNHVLWLYSVVSRATKLWVGERLLGSVIFICISEDAWNILCVFCSYLSCLSSFWSLWFIGMTSKMLLRESSYILTFSIKFAHSELHPGGFPGSLGGCTTSYVSEMPKRSDENICLCISFWLEVLEQHDIKLRASRKRQMIF